MKPQPALTPPPEVPLHNKYDPLIPNTMCDYECNAKINNNKRNGPKTQPRANQNIRRSPNNVLITSISFGTVRSVSDLMAYIQIELDADYLVHTYVMLLGRQTQT